MNENKEQFQNLDCWAVIDLFGHQNIAGKVTTQTLGAAALIRVDVPEILIPERDGYRWRDGKREPQKIPSFKKGGYTRFFGVGAIYSISPVSEELARAAVASIDAEPVKPFEIAVRPALPQAAEAFE